MGEVIDLNICVQDQDYSIFSVAHEYHILEAERGLYLHLSLPWPFQMQQEDHLRNHLCRFHIHYSVANVVEEVHGLEVDHVSYHVVVHAFHDEAVGGCKLEVGVMEVYVD